MSSLVSSAIEGIPIIDLGRLRGPGALLPSTERALALVELREALHVQGFIYVVNHGVDGSITDNIFSAARDFFALPLEERLAIENIKSKQFRGYTRLGNEHTKGIADQRDQIDILTERPALELTDGDPKYLGLVGPNQWPASLPSFKTAALTWLESAKHVGIEILRALAESFDLEPSYFDQWFDEEAHDHLKVIRYPGQQDRIGNQGVGPHKDYAWLAVLLQDDIGGLQVESQSGSWIPAPPIPNTFVVNIGEMLEVATNGYLRATVHRVVSPESDNDRISIPFFLGPRLDAVIPAIRLSPELQAKCRGVEQDPNNPVLACFGEKSVIGWMRSHPRVAERWW
jgi:isopenicillin N synthase-like dioxygenase